MKIRLAGDIQPDSIVDGEGIRTVIWTQGCNHNCLGCHNPETHSFSEGILVDVEDVKQQITKLKGQTGITFSGGDPMAQPKECASIAKFAKSLEYNIWCYTGYTYEKLIELSKANKDILEFLKYIDVLVDGPFILSKKSYDAKFRGSTNQRLIDVAKTMKENKIVLKEDTNKIKITKRKLYI